MADQTDQPMRHAAECVAMAIREDVTAPGLAIPAALAIAAGRGAQGEELRAVAERMAAKIMELETRAADVVERNT